MHHPEITLHSTGTGVHQNACDFYDALNAACDGLHAPIDKVVVVYGPQKARGLLSVALAGLQKRTSFVLDPRLGERLRVEVRTIEGEKGVCEVVP